jgi:metal-responsive CopG/Arc/MetJ family transcriptional regulator
MHHNDAMRTTITLNDELLCEAKHLAAQKQCSLSDIVNEALRSSLKSMGKTSEPVHFEMPTYGRLGTAKAISPSEMARMIEEDDMAL